MSDAPAAPVGRPMKYPYTFSAKVAQFPYKFYFNNVWLFRYWMYGLAVSLPLFYKLGQGSYAPANVKKWEEIRRKELGGGGHH